MADYLSSVTVLERQQLEMLEVLVRRGSDDRQAREIGERIADRALAEMRRRLPPTHRR